MENLFEEIYRLRKESNAIILAHNYQLPEVQDISDFVGDSLELAQVSARTTAEVVVICGVYFMAETAAILNPDKKILLPDKRADCPMARMINAAKVRELKARYPEAAVVCYVNSTAEVKAESDICCTSSNALRVIESLSDYKQVIFVPDRNLGQLLSLSSEKEFILADGLCPVHQKIRVDTLDEMKKMYQDAEVLAHGECTRKVKERADKILSTGQMCSYIRNSQLSTFIIATEVEILYRMRNENPDKLIMAADSAAVCPDMKLCNLEKIRNVLLSTGNEITVEKVIADRARVCIERMLCVG